ncbi:galanin receptor type 1-like [Lineus longissimus]|uniref:galanin receptor type 1-like n=1 Tax=Lineus longissimus TaxID=88925 RepID=UPI00315CEDF4
MFSTAKLPVASSKIQAVSQALWYIVPPFLCFVGSSLNILTITVLLVRRVGKASTRILLISLALVDTAVLLGVLFPMWFEIGLGMSPITLIAAICPIHKFTAYFFLHCASWNVMLITVERLISVIYPFKAKIICTAKNTSLVIGTVFLFLFALNTHLLVFWKQKETRDTCVIATEAYDDFFHFIWQVIDLPFNNGIPFLVIVACNVSILIAVIRGYSHRRELQNPGHCVSEQSARMTSMTFMLTTVSVTFIVLTLPISVFYVVSSFTNLLPVNDLTWLIHDILTFLSYSNNGINFLLYCLSGSQFRREVCLMFRCRNLRLARPINSK